MGIDPLKLRKTSYGGAASLKNKSPRRVVGEVKKEYPGPIYKDIDLGKFKYKNETVGLPKATTKRTERIAKEDKDRVFEGYGNEKDKKKEGLARRCGCSKFANLLPLRVPVAVTPLNCCNPRIPFIPGCCLGLCFDVGAVDTL